MARKKTVDMTVQELADLYLKKTSWDKAEGVGVEILARCLARHLHAVKDGDTYFEQLMDKLVKRCDEWSAQNTFPLACMSVALKHERENNK